MRIEISRSAEGDLLDGFRFYESREKGVGHYFLDCLIADIESLIIYGGVHRKIGGFHRTISKRFPFAIYYKVEDGVVRIRRVLDCRRNPAWIRTELKKG